MVSPIPNFDKVFLETFVDRKSADGQEIIDSVQYFSDFISAFMIIRLFFVFKCIFNYSKYRDPFSKTICKEHNFFPSNWFILKVKNEKKPLKTVLSTSIALILAIWWWILLFELETLMTTETIKTVSPQFASLYLTMITLTTVGYGDITPSTTVGRVIIMFAAVFGIIQISLVVNVVSNLMSLDENEKNAIDKIDQSRGAASAISKSIKYLKHKKSYFRQLK